MDLTESINSEDDVQKKKPQKLTNWANEPTVIELQDLLTKATPAHDEWVARVQEWRNLLNAEGHAKPKKLKGRSSVQPKIVRRQAEWRYAALSEPFLSSSKIFSVYPRTFEDSDAARQSELLLNYQFNTKLNKIKFIDELVRTTVDEGTSVVRLGWNRETELVTEQVPVYSYFPAQDPSFAQTVQQSLQLKQTNPRMYEESTPDEVKAAVDYFAQTNQITVPVLQGYQQVQVEKIKENRPTVDILDPENVFIDPSCNGVFENALFTIVSFETNKAALQAEGIYSNLDSVNWESSATPINDYDHVSSNESDFNFPDTSRKKVVAYEFWGDVDINNDGILVPIVATWIGNTMIRMELNPYPDGKLPFVVIPYLPVKRSLYGEPDAALLEDNQKIIGALVRGMIDLLARSANSQQGFAKGMLDRINREKFDSGQDYEFNPVIPLQQGYIQHAFPEIPQSALVLLNEQNQEVESLTGIRSFTGGLSSDVYGKTVSKTGMSVDAAGKREMSILRRLAKGVSDIGAKILAMDTVFLSEEEVIRVTNRTLVTIKREDIQGSFDLEVEINTAEVDDAKSQDIGFLLQTIGPNLDPKITFEMMAQIADLKRLPDLAEKLRTYTPQPDPIQAAKAQAEVQKIQSEAQYNMSRAKEAEADAQVALIEAQFAGDKVKADLINAQARAQESSAKARKSDIDTMMIATGKKHAEEMEKQQAQAQGNQKLEITKALLHPRKKEEGLPDIDAAEGYRLMSTGQM